MPSTAKSDPVAIATDDPFVQLRAALLESLWEPALRFTMDLDHASEHCRRRACRTAGGCRMSVVAGQPIDCGGSSALENVIIAGGLAWFATAMVADHIEDYIFGGRLCTGLAASVRRR